MMPRLLAAMAVIALPFLCACTDRDETGRQAKHEVKVTKTAAPAADDVSRVISKKDRNLADGSVTCAVTFAYRGRAVEDVLWDEPCADVDARMVDKAFLTSLDKWERLDDFQQRFVAAMPEGKVLYVAGAASASVYPVDSTGTSIEVTVAD